MSSVYESLKGVVQDTLQRSKTIPPSKVAPLDGIESETVTDEHANLADEIDSIENFITEKISRLKSAAKQTESLLTQESERAQETITSLRERIASLEGQVGAAEEKLRSRSREFDELTAHTEALTKRVGELESSLAQAKDETAAETRRASQLMETSSQKLSALENRVKELDDLVQQKQSTIRDLEQKLASVNQELAVRLEEREKLTAARDAEMNDLKSQLSVFTRWLQEMPSITKQGEPPALPVEQQNGSAIVERTNGAERKPSLREGRTQAVAPKIVPPANQTVAPTFFDLMARELTLIKGPTAAAAIREKVTGLGESMDQFPRSRLAELLEALSKDIINDDLKIAFRKWFVKHA